MQSFELLGGKYQQGELIAPGVIQTYRSFQVPSCRPVFIHRLPMDKVAGQDLGALLSAGLIHSSAVRKMIVDLYEVGSFRFVVTEPSRECVPFVGWLEREAGEHLEGVEVNPPAQPERTSSKQPDQKSLTPAGDPAAVKADPGDGEFSRLFHEALAGKAEQPAGSQPSVASAGSPATEQSKAADEPAASSQPASIPQASEPPEREFPVSAHVAQLFTPVSQQPAVRSNLVIFLVVLGVAVVAVAMGVVLFLKR